MGIFKAACGVIGFLGKAVAEEVASEIKRNTGVDLAKELQPHSKELDKFKKGKKDLEANKEEFIKLYGEEAYKEEISYYSHEINFIRKAMYDDIKGLAYETRLDREEKYTEQVKTLTDKQLLHLGKRDDMPEFLEEIVHQEIRTRGL